MKKSLPSWASAMAFSVLALVLALLDKLPPEDAGWLAVSALAAFVPSGWVAPVGWKRRTAEAALVPVATVLLLVADLSVRRMLTAPLLVASALVALLASLPVAHRRSQALLWIGFGLATRAAGGLGFVGFGVVPAAAAIAASVTVTWAVGERNRFAGIAAGLLLSAVPMQRWPLTAVALAAVAVWMIRRRGDATRTAGKPGGWLPMAVALGLAGVAVAPWGGIPLRHAFPMAGWICLGVLAIAFFASLRLPPAVAGLVWFLAASTVGPPQGPTPEGTKIRLPGSAATAALPVGTGEEYILDLSLRGGRLLETGSPVAILTTDGGERTLRVGVDAAVTHHRRQRMNAVVMHGLPDLSVWYPSKIGGHLLWRVVGRTFHVVQDGERPVLARHPDLPGAVEVVVEAAGPVLATAPRDWTLSSWMWATALVVVLLQLFSGGLMSSWSLVPWAILILGQLVSRAWIEPLRTAAERNGVDLAMAALLAAWLPAAWLWIDQRRVVRAVAALLVPLAIATPHLTPPLYGDEPYHLRIMESVVDDGDLDLKNNLDPKGRPNEKTYAMSDRLMHSPVLAFLLIPGFVLAGRTGALMLLALAGGLLAALISRRASQLGIGANQRRLMLLGLALSYPVATYATQIWVELPGALMVAGIAVAAAGPRGGRWVATVSALLATAIKTRLGLIVFPVAAAAWWRGGRKTAGVGLAVLAGAASISLAVGWITMGHPFGYFRRLRHLLPSDPVTPLKVIGGLAFDPAGGLLFTAPLCLVAVAAAGLLWKRGGPGERAMIVGGMLTVIALLHSQEWYGGGAPPARYLVPLIPVFALTWGLVLKAPVRWRRFGEVLAVPSLMMWWSLITRPHFSINPGDGHWWLSDVLARRLAADAQALVPSFLVPTTATVLVPLLLIGIAVVARLVASHSRAVFLVLLRTGTAVWLIAATAVSAAVVLRYDGIVDAEAAHVRRLGGSLVPPEGTVSRHSRLRGWRVADGQGLVVPLHLRADSEVLLEGWLDGDAKRQARIDVRWDDGETQPVRLGGGATEGRLRLPDPPGPGRHRLRVIFHAPPGGTAVFDRIIVEH